MSESILGLIFADSSTFRFDADGYRLEPQVFSVCMVFAVLVFIARNRASMSSNMASEG